jgi:hypothetical protein
MTRGAASSTSDTRCARRVALNTTCLASSGWSAKVHGTTTVRAAGVFGEPAQRERVDPHCSTDVDVRTLSGERPQVGVEQQPVLSLRATWRRARRATPQGRHHRRDRSRAAGTAAPTVRSVR